jgi:ubiquinone/menaquinone biosynthesis C-methylase UbiE
MYRGPVKSVRPAHLAAAAAAVVGVGAATAWKLRGGLVRKLQPRPGERLLGAGRHAGSFAAEVAEKLWPGGELALVDVPDSAADEAHARGLESVQLVGDATRLPFDDASFDGAYVTGATDFVELKRVLKPGSRVFVGDRRARRDAVAAGLVAAGRGRYRS